MKKIKDTRILILFVGLFVLLLILFLTNFRTVRDSIPPEIGEHKIVGYAQYFGYPLYLDTFVFFAFILYPILFFTLFKCLKKGKNK